MHTAQLDHRSIPETGWFCVTDSALSVVFISEVASRWLGVQPGEGVRLLVYLPELAEAILAAREVDFPLTCSVGADQPDRQPISLAVHRLSGSMNGFVFCEKMLSHGESTQFGRDVFPDLFDTHRYATLGMLLGGVVHDFNNILTGILGHVSYLRAILPADGEHRESLVSIEEGARRAAALTQSLRAVSRPEGEAETNQSDACATIRQLGSLLRTVLPPTVSLAVDTPASPVWVRGLDGLIGEMIVSFTTALFEGELQPASVRVAVQEVLSSVAAHTAGLEGPFGRFLLISVGSEHPPERGGVSADRMAELPLLRRRVAAIGALAQSAGGWLGGDAESQQVSPSTIEIWLPLEDVGPGGLPSTPRADNELAAEGAGHDTAPRGGERILVIDDEPSVRNVVVMSLEQLGYTVMAVDSGKAAITAYRDAPVPFDLVVLDMILPEVSGDQVFAAIRRLNPRARILVLSGFSPAGRVQRLLEEGGCVFVQKPFAVIELARRIRECLALPWGEG